MPVQSILSEPQNFRCLTFSSTHTYMNSPTNKVTLVSPDGADVDVLDLSFPESAGKSGNYYRRVMKFRVAVDKVTVYWNGEDSRRYDLVVKVDPNAVEYLVRNDDGIFEPVSHPEHPSLEQRLIAKAFLKDATFIDTGVFILGESTTPSNLNKLLGEMTSKGSKIVAVGSGGPEDVEALNAVTSIGLDPRKLYDYWRQIDKCRVAREQTASISYAGMLPGGVLEFDVARREPALPLVAAATTTVSVSVSEAAAEQPPTSVSPKSGSVPAGIEAYLRLHAVNSAVEFSSAVVNKRAASLARKGTTPEQFEGLRASLVFGGLSLATGELREEVGGVSDVSVSSGELPPLAAGAALEVATPAEGKRFAREIVYVAVPASSPSRPVSPAASLFSAANDKKKHYVEIKVSTVAGPPPAPPAADEGEAPKTPASKPCLRVPSPPDAFDKRVKEVEERMESAPSAGSSSSSSDAGASKVSFKHEAQTCYEIRRYGGSRIKSKRMICQVINLVEGKDTRKTIRRWRQALLEDHDMDPPLTKAEERDLKDDAAFYRYKRLMRLGWGRNDDEHYVQGDDEFVAQLQLLGFTEKAKYAMGFYGHDSNAAAFYQLDDMVEEEEERKQEVQEMESIIADLLPTIIPTDHESDTESEFGEYEDEDECEEDEQVFVKTPDENVPSNSNITQGPIEEEEIQAVEQRTTESVTAKPTPRVKFPPAVPDLPFAQMFHERKPGPAASIANTEAEQQSSLAQTAREQENFTPVTPTKAPASSASPESAPISPLRLTYAQVAIRPFTPSPVKSVASSAEPVTTPPVKSDAPSPSLKSSPGGSGLSWAQIVAKPAPPITTESSKNVLAASPATSKAPSSRGSSSHGRSGQSSIKGGKEQKNQVSSKKSSPKKNNSERGSKSPTPEAKSIEELEEIKATKSENASASQSPRAPVAIHKDKEIAASTSPNRQNTNIKKFSLSGSPPPPSEAGSATSNGSDKENTTTRKNGAKTKNPPESKEVPYISSSSSPSSHSTPGSSDFEIIYPADHDGPEDLTTCTGRAEYLIRKIKQVIAEMPPPIPHEQSEGSHGEGSPN
ncbi:hypothetical protein TWF694_000451 [Orbilia ellipsospora]|uniref:Uncharacterized protein n=1 Tax=Orbilia ellipsospora TaxID=2528407 RepID=A0AAV9XQ70_9PEZI